MALIVFTDLDGSLMEHETYSIDAAREALEELSARHIPLILNSSKTAVEMAAIRKLLGLNCPFICENGAALHRDGGEIIEFGMHRANWLDDIHRLRARHDYSFQGFSDWSAAEIASLTGLSAQQAEQARNRVYSEPILWRGSESALQNFQSDLQALNLRLLQGGRFQSIQSLYDKSDAMRAMIVAELEKNPGQALITVALGDSPNDAAMLNAADVAVVIKSGKSSLIHCPEARRIIHTTLPGPAGWNTAMREILTLYDTDQLINDSTPTTTTD